MSQQAGEQSFSEGDLEFINELFRELKGCFPAWAVHLKSAAIQDETKRQWLKSFAENGIDSDELTDKGMIQARKQPTDFFPSPGKFASWCRPPEHWEHVAQAKIKRGLPILPASKDFAMDQIKKARDILK